MKNLITGVAGFIGMHTAKRMLERGETVIGVDNMNSYYDVQLKRDRLAELKPYGGFHFDQIDITDPASLGAFVAVDPPDRVIHLAAQAGVRYSLDHPEIYIQANVVGFANLLEVCRRNAIEHLVYASSSSVYGANHKLPFAVGDPVEQPISLYAATKRCNELMAHVYAHLFELPCTGLRFFTVYGPWGRPDMAVSSFTKAIIDGTPIKVFNNGETKRDFTYIDDIVEGIIRVLDRTSKPIDGKPPCQLYNLGNQRPVKLLDVIALLERGIGVRATKIFVEAQPGDVNETCADITDLVRDTGFCPSTSVENGLTQFLNWYRAYYRVPFRMNVERGESKCEEIIRR